MKLPCGQCIGCRLEKSRQWAVRCVHEASLYEDNCFITLTYRDDKIPYNGGLKVRHFQNFMKYLRKLYAPKTIRFFHCGEYGDQTDRPHYHALIFNHNFPDRTYFSTSNGIDLDTSEILTSLWTKGFSTVGDLTFDSAAYCARYVTKKVNGKPAHYERINWCTGEIHTLEPEYATMSRRPGVGAAWFEKWKTEVFPNDEIIINRRSVKPPKFYDNLYEQQYPSRMEDIKTARQNQVTKYKADLTPERLATREIVKKAQFNQLKRNL